MSSALRRILDKNPKLKKAAKIVARPATRFVMANETKRYQRWAKQHIASTSELTSQRETAKRLSYRPLISVIVPTYNTPEAFFREMADSVLAQTYDNWELIFIDDHSPDETARDCIKQYASKDARIKHKFLSENKQIADATNEGIQLAAGEFVSLFDHDDVLRPNALFEIVKVLNQNKNLDFIYTDEDKITERKNSHHQPFFKPAWNPDLLRSINYITHFTTIRKSVLDKLGYEDGVYNGTQDWELFLRITRGIPATRIHHIPKMLYSWRVHEGSTAKDIGIKPYVTDAQRKALEDDVAARKEKHCTVRQDERYPVQWQAVFRASTRPKVSLVMQDAAQADHIAANTTYTDYDIVVVSPGANCQDILDRAEGDYLVFVGGNLNIQQASWLDDLLGDAVRGDIGFVLAECTEDSAMRNLRGILGSDAVDFIARANRRLAARHFYLTTRYNITTIHGGVTMISKQKLQQSITNPKAEFSIQTASEQVARTGLRNLYNPYVKVLQ